MVINFPTLSSPLFCFLSNQARAYLNRFFWWPGGTLPPRQPRGFMHGVKLGMMDGYEPETVAGKVTAPVLMIAGSEDRVNPIDKNAAILARAMPKARLEIIEGVGHLPEVEVPDKINAMLRAFFED